MLRDDELDGLARAVAALDGEDARRLDEAVRARREEKAAAERDRIATLRAMDDWDVVHECLQIAQADHEEVLGILRDAGFVRADLARLRSAHATTEDVLRRVVALIPKFECPEGHDYATLNRLIMDAATNLSAFEIRAA